MNLPEYIPTDNLYKFIAIFGLIIFVLAIIYPRKALNELYLQGLEIHGQIKIIELQKDSIEKKIESLTLLDKRMFEEREECLKDSFNLQLKTQELDNLNERNCYLVKEHKSYLKYSCAGIIIGIIMIFLGFTLWYFRLQVYQDKIIKKEASEY
jgi:hypothetical protein